MNTATLQAEPAKTVGALQIAVLAHPQGCRAYIAADPASKQALAIDVHLDLVNDVIQRVESEGWALPYVIDTHTHADHPSGAGTVAAHFGSTRIAHELAEHVGVARHPADGETLHLGDVALTIRHAPGHTPDHIIVQGEGALFAGDTLFIGGVARTDFLGGDAGQLFDSIHAILKDLPDDTILYPGHDYEGRTESTIGEERASNPWLRITDRDAFATQLSANKPPRPANMDALLELNRNGVDIPERISAAETMALVNDGGATSVIDVRTGMEFEGEYVDGSRLIPLDQIKARADEVRATPAPRLILCRNGSRAAMAQKTLSELGIAGLSVVEGGIEAYRGLGGETVKAGKRMSLERQVRIVAGAIVLIGIALSLFVHPAFIALAAFIGAGQIFAGVSDWCGMGLLMAKAPWNQSKAEGSGAAGVPSACAADVPAACAAEAPPTSCAAGAPPTDSGG